MIGSWATVPLTSGVDGGAQASAAARMGRSSVTDGPSPFDVPPSAAFGVP